MKNLLKASLFLLFLLAFSSAYACRCSQISIADNYKRAGLIFYGKHLETIAVPNVYDASGKPMTIENFQVIRFYKGADDAMVTSDSAPFKISITSNCNQACGTCYTAGKYYLVYASQHEGAVGIETEMCSRTKEIVQNNFIISGGVDLDAGKDETKELMRLASNDTLSNAIVVGSKWQENKQAEEDIKRKLQKELKKKNSMGLTLATTTLILFFYVVLGWFKTKKNKI